MKTIKHTISALFLTMLLFSVGIANLLEPDVLFDQPVSLTAPVPGDLYYTMQVPFSHGPIYTDRVQLIVLNQYSDSSKTLHQFNYSYVREIRNSSKFVQYICELNQRQLKNTEFLNCVLRI